MKALNLSLSLLLIGACGIHAEEKTKLYEAYAPKPSGPSPAGWTIQILQGSSVDSATKLKNGREIKVTAPVFELVASNSVCVITDPGFDPKLGNNQTATIGATITQYSETTKELQDQLDKTIGILEKSLTPVTTNTGKGDGTTNTTASPTASPTTSPKVKHSKPSPVTHNAS